MSEAHDFPAFCRSVQERYSAAKDGPHPEHPFCLVTDGGTRIDAMQMVRGTLAGLLAILLGLAAAITAIFTQGTVLMVIGGLFAFAMLLWLLHRARMSKAGGEWLRAGRVYPAALIMANDGVLEPGESIVPGALLVDFGERPDPERMTEAGEAIFDLAEEESVSHPEIRDWVRSEMERARYGRIRIPSSIAGNETCWAVSLRLDRNMMPKGFIDRRIWFVLARPDRDESAEILHHKFWAQDD